MEVGDKLKELNMTADEIHRLTKSFKDEKFREMLRDYAKELSDPENKKKYEEEIKLLEQERGNTIEFIHPEPFRSLRTSVNGKQKCFINICANEKVGKPACTRGMSEEGRRGQCWSLPHSLHPGKQDTDSKGNKIMIFDVVFHPDTLHMASKNKGFMDMVESTAIEGIQKAFNASLDKNNVKEMRTKYKGSPQPCVIRKPIPGYKSKEPSERPDPLAFPYPAGKPTTTLPNRPTDSPAEPKIFQTQPQKTKEPTKPNHTVKYRSFIDLQDFRCSRDSAQSPRPKEIVVTIDLPLMKAVKDASLEVKEGRLLLLESEKPSYRLELPLAYPVDEDKGEAKFNKQRGQLIVTLPVLPSNEAFELAAQTSVSFDERQEEKRELGEEDQRKEEERAGLKSEEDKRDIEEENLKQQTNLEKGEEEEERGQEQMKGGENSKEEKEENGMEEEKWKKQKLNSQESVEEEKLKEQKQQNEREALKLNLEERQQNKDKCLDKNSKLKEDECIRAAERKDSDATQCDTVEQCMGVPVEEQNSCVASPETENHPVFTAEHPGCRVNEGEVKLKSCLDPVPQMTTSETKEEAEMTNKTRDGNRNLKVEKDAAFLHQRLSEAVSSTLSNAPSQGNLKDCCISQGNEEACKNPATDVANKSSRGGSGNRVILCSEGPATDSSKREKREKISEDNRPTEQIFHNPGNDSNKPPAVLLREINKDGHEKVISDHSTSAGFIFQNSLMYELD